MLIESGGDNLTATFSPGLVDAQLFVLDVAGGGDVARKDGPGIARADLLVINKIDLAEYVEVDVDQLCAWIRWLRAEHLEGRHVATDPGPMAAHFHSAGEADALFHRHGD